MRSLVVRIARLETACASAIVQHPRIIFEHPHFPWSYKISLSTSLLGPYCNHERLLQPNISSMIEPGR